MTTASTAALAARLGLLSTDVELTPELLGQIHDGLVGIAVTGSAGPRYGTAAPSLLPSRRD